MVYDLVVTGGRLLDGTGGAPFRGDIAIAGGRIVHLGRVPRDAARRRIDARGRVVSPGFIDLMGTSDITLLADGRAASKVTQGITLMVAGERFSAAPWSRERRRELGPQLEHLRLRASWRTLPGFFRRLRAARPSINFGTFVAAGSLRDAVVGRADRPATRRQLREMTRLADQALDGGALGVSSALAYVPHRFASTEELIALARVAARRGAIYATHQRSEGDGIHESLEEVFTVAREAGVAAHIFHLKTTSRRARSRMRPVVRRIAEARARGLAITADVYPYTKAAGNLRALLPPWAREGGLEDTLARLRDREARRLMARDLRRPGQGWDNEYLTAGPEGIFLADAQEATLSPLLGRSLRDIAARRGRDPLEALFDLLLEDQGRSRVVVALMCSEDVSLALRQPWAAFCTDSEHRAADGPLSTGRPHPRAYGAFARALGPCVREERLYSLEEAVRKATSLPARILRLGDRGLLREGFWADLVVFDPRRLKDRSTFEDPHRYAAGVDYVVVNGEIVVDEGKVTAARPGRIVRRSPRAARGGVE